MCTHSKTLKDTAMWKTYETRFPANDARIVWVDKVYDTSVTYLKDVRLSFPNYTLHDETHVLNVLDAMEGILGNQISQLSTEETELLILAACLHDLGMVYTNTEKDRCFNAKSNIRKFLRINKPELLGCPPSEWPEDLRQGYLRWLHPFRLPEVFKNEEWKRLLADWPTGIVPKSCVLAVCQAHGEAPEEFSTSGKLNYLRASNADPLFCTLLLRLADLLDFDDTRAPKVLCSHIIWNEKSREEWEKHQASGGFRYPKSPSTDKLPYRARCANPGIEHVIRDFLDWIDDELNICIGLQQNCHQDWQRRFPFPRAIAREEMESEGYVSGDFQMTMDQTRVMDLLTGEQLYDRNDVFIRELLQNSIDATLLRLEMDHNFLPEDARIDLWEWYDKDGNIWFRIDDRGTGMTLGMLQRYFLKIGNSYYTSRELKRDLRDHGQTADYQSISRFGIGFLSCFLCGTSAEVSTLYFDSRKNREESGSRSDNEDHYGLRLQVTGLQGYYTLKSQAEGHDAADTPMPAPKDYPTFKAISDLEWDGYRAEPGTSISIKLDPGQLGTVNLRDVVKEYLCCAKIPVFYNGERIGRTYAETMDEIHQLEGERVYELSLKWKRKFDEYFPACAGQYPKVYVTIVPLDTEKNHLLPDMSGSFIKYDAKFDRSPLFQVMGRTFEIEPFIDAINGHLELFLSPWNTDKNRQLSWDTFIKGYSLEEVKSLTAALEALSNSPASKEELGAAWYPFEKEEITPGKVWQMWVDHLQKCPPLIIPFQELGIPITDSLTGGKRQSKLTYSYRGVITGKSYIVPKQFPASTSYIILLLLDNELRPTVTISRSEILYLPLELIVAIEGMLYTLVHAPEECLNFYLKQSDICLPAWRKLRESKLGAWLRNNLRDNFKTMKEQFDKPISLKDEKCPHIGEQFKNIYVLSAFLIASLQDSYQMKVNYEEGQVITFTALSPKENTGLYDLFPPMMFCSAATQESRFFLCSGDVNLRRCINIDHPYTKWLLKNAAALNRYYNRQLQQIISVLRNSDSEGIIGLCNDLRDQLLSLPNRHGIDIHKCPQLSEADFWRPLEKPYDN